MAACTESPLLRGIASARDTASSQHTEISVDAATLDPRTPEEWAALRAEAHRMLDGALDSLEGIRESRCWQPMPDRLRAEFASAPVPEQGSALWQVHKTFVTDIAPYATANRSPRAWGWVRGQGTPVAMLADMLAAGLNAHVGGGATAPVLTEETVVRWMAEALGLCVGGREQPSGLLTSGATMANLLGLAVARHAKAGFDVRREGLSGRPRMTVYCSDEVHGWAAKAAETLGLGRRSLHRIACDEAYRLDIHALAQQVAADRVEGCIPFAVIATAGTVNTGAFDDLRGIRSFCDEEELWMHVDGAFGALLRLVPAYGSLVDGLELADSVAFDFHKWMGMPFETGCLLVRDRTAHEAAFRSEAAYMERASRGMLAEGWPSFADRGIEGSRNFKALRVWMQLSALGLGRHREAIAANMRQAEYLETRIVAHPQLKMLAPRAANVVCFGYRASGETREQQSARQREIVLRLQEGGRFVVSGTTLRTGVYAIRVAIVNHRSRREDFDELLDEVVALGVRSVERSRKR